MKWSYSSLKKFNTCAKQFYEVKIAGNYTEPDTHHTIYGKEVHSALEAYANGAPLPKNYKRFKKAVDAVLEIPGNKFPEHKMALKEDRETICDFEAEDYWVRGIADLVIVDKNCAYVVDYKTGSNRYADTNQLKLMALMSFAHFPDVNTVRAGLLFLAHDCFIPEEYRRSQINKLWDDFDQQLGRMKFCHDMNIWPADPSGLCHKHCVVLSCKYNGRSNAEEYDG